MEKIFSAVEWIQTANLYEVNTRQYTPEGTFNAFKEHIPRLSKMGINVLWFMPINPISHKLRQGSRGSYYACSDYKAINPEYGNLEDFKAIVKYAHEHGLKVIIDWVANHTGADHVWIDEHPEYYKKNDQGEFYDNNNWVDVYDLNYYDQGLRQAMVDAMEYWIRECDIDGFRCDMAHLVPLDFWRETRKYLDSIKPLFWLAETEQVNYDQVFDCIYAWDWMHKTEDYAKGKIGVNDLLKCLENMKAKFPLAIHLLFTVNHDENSWNGTEYEKYGDSALPLAVFSATWTGIPLIYSGQEIPNHKRLNFFEKDLIDWSQGIKLEDFYSRLLTLNMEHPALRSCSETNYIILHSEDPHILAYTRNCEQKSVLVVLNLSGHPAQTLLAHGLHGKFRDVFTDDIETLANTSEFILPAGGYKVLAN